MTGDGRTAVLLRDTRDRPAVPDPRMRRDGGGGLYPGSRPMIDPERRDRPAARIAALRDRVTSKLSRLYDGPLLSSLTAVAFMALSIIFNLSLS